MSKILNPILFVLSMLCLSYGIIVLNRYQLIRESRILTIATIDAWYPEHSVFMYDSNLSTFHILLGIGFLAAISFEADSGKTRLYRLIKSFVVWGVIPFIAALAISSYDYIDAASRMCPSDLFCGVQNLIPMHDHYVYSINDLSFFQIFATIYTVTWLSYYAFKGTYRSLLNSKPVEYSE